MVDSANGDVVSGPRLADLANEPYSTIDHWSDLGLLPFTYRGRRRLYDRASALHRCQVIRRMQEQGMNLAGIRIVLEDSS